MRKCYKCGRSLEGHIQVARNCIVYCKLLAICPDCGQRAIWNAMYEFDSFKVLDPSDMKWKKVESEV